MSDTPPGYGFVQDSARIAALEAENERLEGLLFGLNEALFDQSYCGACFKEECNTCNFVMQMVQKIDAEPFVKRLEEERKGAAE